MRRQIACLADQPVVGDTLPDHAPRSGLLGWQFFPQHGKGGRPRHANRARQQPGTAGIGHKTDLGKCLDETRRLRRQHDIAGKRDARARAGGDTVDGAHHRHLKAPDPAHKRVVALLQRTGEIGTFTVGGRRALRQILTGAETTPRARDQQAAHAGFRRLDHVERVAQLLMHAYGEGVEPVGPVQGQGRDRVGRLQGDRLVHQQS